jgi:hypothetical protein
MQAERRKRRGVGMIEDAKDAALLVQPVLFEPAEFLGLKMFRHGLKPPPCK